MKRVLFVGDVNVDINMGGLESDIQKDREIFCQNFSVSIGSTVAITACHYADKGGEAHFCGEAGNDSYGEFMLKGLKMYNVNTDLVSCGNTPTGVTVNLTQGRERSQVTYPGSIAAFNGKQVILENLERFDHIHLAGPYLQTAFRPHIAELLRQTKNKGITTSLDPQWDITEKWEFMEEWLPLLTYLFVNEDEGCSIAKTDTAERAYFLLKEKTNLPLLKIGKEGVFYEGKIYPPVDVPVTDTTGAGDTFSAAFLYAILEKRASVEEAIEEGNREASQTCTYRGGVPRSPRF